MEEREELHAEIVLNIPLSKVFHYAIPSGLRKHLRAGMRVKIPFGNKTATGFCVGLTTTPSPYPLKDIISILDKTPLTNEIMLRLTRWLSSHYHCGWGEAMHAVVPPVIRCRAKLQLAEKNKLPDCKNISDNQNTLQQHLTFTREQQNAFNSIHEKLSRKEPGVILLHGITGSGKTEIYLQAIDKVLEQGRKAIFLVPEISLTSQTIQRIRSRFNRVAVLHSNLLGSFYHAQWHTIREDKADIVVGTRSSVFCPLKNIGLIVIDEEHENTYKQENSPRYHARDVALKRATYENALVLLGSATPSLESYYHTLSGDYERLVLSRRIGELRLPSVEVIDMREEMRKRKRHHIISQKLEYSMGQALAKNEQIILFLNRRGFAPYIHCKRCGFVLKCRRCDIPMTFHKKRNITLCHYCHTESPPPQACPDCLASRINYHGFGTEKIEDEIAARFPNHRIARMDSDSMRIRDAHEKTLKAFERGEVQILLGTQMIAKGLDFPNVTLVGIISADTMLNFPDFRASERTFQLISQVAGRAGRGSGGGRVIVQSFHPEHYSIRYAAAHDYEGFAEKELEFRRQLGYPPFGKLARIVFRSTKEDRVRDKASSVANTLKELTNANGNNLVILGPSPAPFTKINTMFRWHLFLQSQNYGAIHSIIKDIEDMLKPSKSVQAIVDIDPYMML
ncbi:MAG: replication restart helicase PriA [Candidatus Loosdrechtia sp.]|uniref:primosomal protein N' n=1 Tax=Candidatus Loosdrechtia sp. TaxID=3101272 RepID=UPI003A6DCE98|nr:MAG: primosomal protein N' [Candidatus Jettenia sp. AMX2]